MRPDASPLFDPTDWAPVRRTGWRLAVFVTLLGIAAGGAELYRRHESTRLAEEVVLRATADAVSRLDEQIKFRAATRRANLNVQGWPQVVDESWFSGSRPENALLRQRDAAKGGLAPGAAERPWLEVAGKDEARLSHPPVRLALEGGQAAFWYNPYRGIVRARVPGMISDERALATYNQVNGCALASIIDPEPDIESASTVPLPSEDPRAGSSRFGRAPAAHAATEPPKRQAPKSGASRARTASVRME
ncbi:MAG: hypothetical protein JNM07_07135 [Phycisphaerae bacterium]|nr:hypothetical protein [Phycisphaerae bacterium]